MFVNTKSRTALRGYVFPIFGERSLEGDVRAESLSKGRAGPRDVGSGLLFEAVPALAEPVPTQQPVVPLHERCATGDFSEVPGAPSTPAPADELPTRRGGHLFDGLR